MKSKKEKAAFIQKILEEKFPHPEIPLHHTSHFTLLCAVLLSAQCTDKKVNEVTPHLFAIADAPEKMAALTYPAYGLRKDYRNHHQPRPGGA